jgi:hypothetical protein
MQRYTVYLYLETALHVSGGTSTHHQERIQLHLQHLVFVTHRYCYLSLETRPPPRSYGNQWLQRQFERAPDDGHDNARNMLSSVYETKQ